MQCDNCGANEAIMHFTQIVNNEVSTFHLCEVCAAEKGLEPGLGAGDFPLADLLAQMGGTRDSAAEDTPGQCGYCNLRLENFKKTGRLGCSHCYVAFESHLRGLLRRLHGGTQHVGKIYLPPDPTEAERRERLEGLKRRLDRAVVSEDFERAALLRDQIRTLEAAVR
jgi:protein arginine kinase activator